MRDPVTIALRCQDAGARVLALHRARARRCTRAARTGTRSPPSSTALDIPVLGNGDIKTPHDALRMRRADEVRRRHDRARLVRPAVDLRSGARDCSTDGRCAAAPSVEERFAIALDHARMANDYEPDPRGAAIEFRKHLGWYVKGLPGSARAAQAAARRDVARRSRRHLRRLSRRSRAVRAGSTAGRRRATSWRRARHEARARSRSARAGRERIARRRRDALDTLALEPVESLGFATIDHHRALRQGFPEVIYGAGKTAEQIVRDRDAHRRAATALLVTRVRPRRGHRSSERFPAVELQHASRARRYLLGREAAGARRTGTCSIVTAGTSDLPVAEEAAVTRARVGQRVARLTDVGVAGIHRVLVAARGACSRRPSSS